MSDIHDPKYEFSPGMFNFSAWSRDNIPKGEPKFKVGDRVVLTIPLYVQWVGEDCDGTPLFAAGLENPAALTTEEAKQDWSLRVSCLSADSFRAATPEEIAEYDR